MSNFPQNFDDDVSLPVVNDNLTEIGGDAINALRDAVFNIEQNIGLGAAGTTPSITARLGLVINPDGTPNASALTSLGLVTLPITNSQIIANAGIPESKLHLDFRTQDLFNYIRDLSKGVNQALGWIAVTGVKLEPHLLGAIYRHDMSQIDVAEVSTAFLNNKFRVPRDNTNSYTLVNDINNELLAHQWADGSPFGTIKNVITNNGSSYPSNYAHIASGIFLQSSVFSTVPQTANNLQLFAEFVDSSSLLLLGSRIQNLYSNGISRNSRSSALLMDGYGQLIVPSTLATTFLRNTFSNNYPTDDIKNGDDIIQFTPSGSDGYVFASQFAAVRVGDILRVNYGAVEVDFIILEKKFIPSGNDGYSTFIVRVNGKNLEYTTTALASVNRPLANNNKYGVLAMAPVTVTGITDNSTKVQPSLIIGSPRGAQVLGIGFDADQFDGAHYLLYLGLYPTGNPQDGYLILPPIDVTGNQGTTPGQYTLEGVVSATNAAFRQPGYNYRFIAFQYQGQFGVMLADSYNNASFSIFSVVLDGNGIPSASATSSTFTNNVVGVLSDSNNNTPDPLGFGPNGANVASPPYQSSFASVGLAIQPTKLFIPLKRNNYYVDGVEKEQLSLDVGQAIDKYGDGYWIATVTNISTAIAGTVEVTYNITLDLSTSNLKSGKTLVVQSLGEGGSFPNDFGRFIIKDVSFECLSGGNTTSVTVYDAVHGVGISPAPVLAIGSTVAIYFNSGSVSFDAESATDFSYYSPFKRFFEIYIDEEASTFTHERGRTNIGGTNQNINNPPGTILVSNTHSSLFDVVSISPKLRGYQFGAVTKITLNITSFNSITGIYTGFLCSWSGNLSDPKTNLGPVTIGKQGQNTRFYDETEVDFIDINLQISYPTNVVSFTNEAVDIQLFPSLELDEQIMILGSCQINTVTQVINYVSDLRQFGNTSEEQLTTSALNFISAPDRLLTENAIIRGFDLVLAPTPGFIALTGTFNVNNGSPTITASVSQTGFLNAGSLVTFSTSPGVTYTVFSVAGTNIVLTTNYLGTSAGAATGTVATIFPNEITFNGGVAIVNGNIIQVNNQTVSIPVVQEIVAPTGSATPNNTITWFICVNDKGNYQLIASTDFDPNSTVAGIYNTASLDENRLFYANNPNNLNPFYVIRSTYFDDLIQNQKDVVVVGLITTTIAVETVNSISSFVLKSATFNDARRFVYNGYGGLSTPFVFGVEGSFRSFNSLNTWLAQLTTLKSSLNKDNNIGIKVIVKGNTVLSGLPINLNYGQEVIFEGDGGIFTITNAIGFTLGSNVKFKNIRFDYTFNPVGDGNYSTSLLSNPNRAAIYCEVDPVSGNKNLSFEHCLFTSNNIFRYGFIGFNFAASTCYAENIQIVDNRFETSASGDDKLAIVTFVAPATNPTTSNGARLNNCVIERNFCNKNQLMIIASPIVSSNILDLITATNTRIIGNTCGAINVMIKHDLPLTIANTNFDLDKLEGVIIRDNTCRYIYSGYANGNIANGVDTSATRAIFNIQSGFNFVTGSLYIINNTCSFIHVGYRVNTIVPTLGNPPLIIKQNRLSAYNIAYLTQYFNNVVQISLLGLIVDKVVGT